MLGLLYLILCLGVGWGICSYAFPDLASYAESTYDNKNLSLSPYILLLPAWFITGVLATTWSVYIVASFASKAESPLTVANAIILPAALCFFSLAYYDKKIRKQEEKKGSFLCKNFKIQIGEFVLFGFVFILAFILMWSTFYAKGGKLNIGVTVFSDFSPHIGMIRSFSYGNNFPTSYSHYAGEDIKYHFMFQFLAGNLEFLGMRIDYAFNIPSMISFICAFMLLYVLALKITGRISAGVLACLFFAFRSSKALFIFLSKIPEDKSILKALWENTEFIGDTTHEDWGLWNLNVYCNQRHLAFGLSAMFFVLILFLPRLYDMYNDGNRLTIKRIFLSKEAWEIKDARYPAALGILLGSLSFFHGSVVIGCLLVLFVTAIFSKRRLEFLITAVITVLLSVLQTKYFISGPAVAPKLLFGFISEKRTLFGVLSYIDRLLGVLPFVIFAAFLFAKWVERYIILAFLAPFVFAFTVSLTVDVTVNHKYIMMSCILVGIFAAHIIVKMFDKKENTWRIAAGLLIFLLTITGIYDFITVIRKNSNMDKIILNMDDPLTEFVRRSSNSKDIFLTDPYTINQLVFGGAMLFQGHQYYAWSAGYDTDYRDIMVKRMYEAKTPAELDMLVEENNIRFIVVEYANRISEKYDLNEDNIRRTYECVYEAGDGEWKYSVFDTEKKIFDKAVN